MKHLLIVLLALLTSFTHLNAGPSASVSPEGPTVSLDVLIKGKQAVMSDLLKRVNYAVITATGDSVAGPDYQRTKYLWPEMLKNLGYVNAGSFSQLEKAISQVDFQVAIIPVPQGEYRGYDVRIEILLYDGDNKVLIKGKGYPNIARQSDGSLTSEETPLYVWMHDFINIPVSKSANSVRWVSARNGSQELSITYSNNENFVTLPSYMIQAGMLLVSEDKGFGPEITGYDLVNGYAQVGQRLWLAVGQLQSGDVSVIKDQAVYQHTAGYFYLSNREVHGSFPLIELVATKAFVQVDTFDAKVWGTKELLAPVEVTIEVIKDDTGKLPREFSVPRSRAGYVIALPAGTIIHLRIKYQTESDGGRG